MLSSAKEKIIGRVDKLTASGKVYIFLTASGGYFSSLIFVLFIISLSYANSLAYLSSFLFFSVVFVSCHVTNFNLYGLDLVQLKLEDFYIEGREAWGTMIIKNSGDKTRFDIEGSVLKGESDYILEIKPGESREVQVELPSKKPGIYSFKRIQIRTSFPFGIFRSWKPIGQKGEVVVIPRPSIHPLPQPRIESGADDGALRSKRQREEFSTHQRYVNQSIGQIDWKIYARREELYSREYDSPMAPTYVFNLNQAYGSNKKEKLECLTHWVLSAYEEGARFRLELEGETLEMESGREHFKKALTLLAKGAQG